MNDIVEAALLRLKEGNQRYAAGQSVNAIETGKYADIVAVDGNPLVIVTAEIEPHPRTPGEAKYPADMRQSSRRYGAGNRTGLICELTTVDLVGKFGCHWGAVL